MTIAGLAVRNPRITLVGLALMVALGASAFGSVIRSEDPSFPIPTFAVVAILPGASPSDLEQLVADPIEAALRELEGVKEVVSTARPGYVTIRVDFHTGVDVDAKYADVVRELERVRPELPDDLVRLGVDRWRTSNVSIVQIGLVSATSSYATLAAQAEQLERRLERIAGVRRAVVWAAPDREVRVTLDLERLAALGLTPDHVVSAIGRNNATIAAGTLDSGRRTFGIRTGGRFASLDDIRETVVVRRGSDAIRVDDLADVALDDADQGHIGRYRGEKAVFVTAELGEGGDVLAVRQQIDRLVARFRGELPAAVRLERGFDQAANVDRRLSRLYDDFLLAIALVLLTLLPIGFRASLVVMASVPLSLALGVATLHAFGYSLNQLSIVGFVIALGLLVDDSIVVVENITRRMREGSDRLRGSIEGTNQIATAVLGCTATLVFAFVPLLYLPGSAGDYIRSLPVAVIATVVASLVVSLTIVPFLASRLLPKRASPHGNAALHVFERLVDATYSRALAAALVRPRATLALVALLFVGAVLLVPTVGFGLFPKAGTPQFLIRVETPEGGGLPATSEAVDFVEGVLERHSSDLRYWFSNVGRGNPAVYYNTMFHPQDERYGELLVELVRYDPRKSPLLLESLRDELRTYPGARIELVEFENGPPLFAPIAIRVVADDLEVLARMASRVEREIALTPGTRDVENPTRIPHTDLAVDVDRTRAGLVGVSVDSIARNVRLAVAGLDVGRFRDTNGKEHRIRVVSPRGPRAGVEVLDRIYVTSDVGRPVPLAQVAHVHFESSTPVIERRNGERIAMVSAHVTSTSNVERVTHAVEERLARITRPPGVRFEIAGERESRNESFGGLGSAVLVAIFGILLILLLEFGTFRSTLIVALVIPLGFVGGVAFLWIAGMPVSFTAAIGFVALIGIEIKNAILLVDATNQLRREGMALDDAIRRAGEMRFLPIVLTTATAIGGFLPLAIQGAPLYAPLAVVVIGGLVSSTVLGRIVTPVAYKLFPPSLGDGAADERELEPSGTVELEV